MSVVYHEFVSIVRQKQRNVQMLTEENSEEVWNYVMVDQDEMMCDPAYALKEHLDIEERLEDFAKAVQLLPPRQMYALMCSVTEKVDDIVSFKKVMEGHYLHVEMFTWPDDEAEKKLLKASLHPARRNIARFMGITLPRK